VTAPGVAGAAEVRACFARAGATASECGVNRVRRCCSIGSTSTPLRSRRSTSLAPRCRGTARRSRGTSRVAPC